MEKVFGLDLGTNSIGWAIREINNELENQIIDKGVLTFDKGVAEDKSGEHPMVQKRTESRGKRRNYQAEKYRKWELLECLINECMCPLTIEELNEWRHYKKGTGRKYPQSEKFIQWLRFDFDGDSKPDFERLGFSKHESYYLFRTLLVDEKQIAIFKKEPEIIGRVLYQLVQRRGYNDGQNIDETEKDELSKTIMKGGGDSGALGVNNILPYLEKHRTLGSALYHIQKEQSVRIRKRYNLRSHYEKEIKEICRVQGLEHLYKAFWGAIIWQRPLRGQKGLVGVCTFEQNKRRCPISHPLYEQYRTWVFINNLKIKPLIENDIKVNKMPLEEALHQIVYPQFFKAAPDFKLSSIAKELKKVGFEITARFPEDTKVISFSFLYKMKEIFGDGWEDIVGWNDLLNIDTVSPKVKYNIEDLWHLHFTKTPNKKTGEEPFEFLKRFALEKLGIEDESKAETFAKIRLQQGYATLSINAIKKILPYLQKGFIYSEAIYLANLPKVMGLKKLSNDDIDNFSTIIKEIIKKDRYEQKKIGIINSLVTAYFENKKTFEENKVNLIEQYIIESYGQSTWNRLPVERMANIEGDIVQEIERFLLEPKQKPENHYRKTGRLHDKIFVELMNDYAIPAENIKHLWHPSEQETYLPALEKDGKHYLGSPEPISKGFKNPMALKTLHKLKKLVNYLIETGKISEDTRIVIEIARELNDANKRKAIERWQREREKQNETFKNQIIAINKECGTNYDVNDKTLIDRIRLWEEQSRLCIYTGKMIGLCDILDGGKYDFEHTIPASMSFDNELKNLTIADKTYNQQIKAKRLPSECPNYETSYEYNGITYPSILSTMQTIFGRMHEVEKKIKGKKIVKRSFEKIVALEKDYEEWRAKKSDDKEIKDNIITRRHLIKMELDYWRNKLQSFTTTEYKAGWRNSQLRDTQTITKYALPYLKTVFNKVEVQKGNITSDFRKIYKIQPRLDKKERNKHSHHAIDAAVLTLIPPAAIRDKILLRYNEANENKQGYHEKPKQWDNFHQQHIIGIEDEILINYQAQHRTLTPTYKTVRKRGQIQFVKEKLPDGKWQYKLGSDGNKIPLVAKGDSIRGNLHKESFFGVIKMPLYEEKDGKFIPTNDGKGNLIFQKNEKRGDELFIVEREIDLNKFSKIEDFDIVIDPNLRQYLKKLIQTRIITGKSFAQAMLEPIYAFGKSIDKNGNKIMPIRHIRVRAKGSGSFIQFPAEIRKKNNFISKQEYKNYDYAANGEVPVCILYQGTLNDKVERQLQSFTILEIAKANSTNLIVDAVPATYEKKIGKQIFLLPLYSILMSGKKVIFFEHEIKDLKDLNKSDLSKRTYVISSFEEGKVYLKHHLCSLKEDDIKLELKKMSASDKGSSKVNFINPFPKLRLSQGLLEMAIEDKHFEIKIDGSIEWKF
jgi:CRISPR-associated endonuclease Csn1